MTSATVSTYQQKQKTKAYDHRRTESLPFHFVCSAAWEDEHTLTYESEDGRLGFCDHTPKRKNGDFGKTRRHWHIDGKVYKTKEKFIAALADFNPNVLPINHRPYQNTVARMKFVNMR